MPRKNDRPIARHIEKILKENQGVLLRFVDIYKIARERGWRHNYSGISDNLKFLIDQNKVVKKMFRYGIPIEREDGSKYFIFKEPGSKDEIIEYRE